MTNPDVVRMNRTQWLFEYHALKKKEMLDVENNIEVMRAVLISTLGLNAMRPKDEQGRRKVWKDMTDEERKSFIPLIAWCGHPEMVQKAYEGIEDEVAIIGMAQDEAYERMVQAIDDSGGDMEPILEHSFGEAVYITAKDDRSEEEKRALGIKDISEAEIDVEGDV